MTDQISNLKNILAKKWNWELTPIDANSLQFVAPVGDIYFNCYVEINSEMNAFLFRAILPMPVQAEFRQTAMEFVTQVNYDLPVGCFALNLKDGDCRWKSGIYFGSAGLTESLVEEILNSSLFFLERYYHGLVKISIGKSLNEAFESLKN